MSRVILSAFDNRNKSWASQWINLADGASEWMASLYAPLLIVPSVPSTTIRSGYRCIHRSTRTWRDYPDNRKRKFSAHILYRNSCRCITSNHKHFNAHIGKRCRHFHSKHSYFFNRSWPVWTPSIIT